MRSEDYWKQRTEAIASNEHVKADNYISRGLLREYEKARLSIQREIDSFYARFAENNQIDLSEARRLLSSDEHKDFQLSLEQYTRLAKTNPDGLWTKKLNNASYKVRVSRLEALQIQIEATIQNVNMAQNIQMTKLLSEGFSDTYYHTMYEVQKGLGVGTTFAKLDDSQIRRIITKPWLEQNYSQRIWGDNSKLVRQLETEITQAFITGQDNRQTARIIADRMGVGYRNASRLVRTEMTHVQNEASFNAYRESGVVKKYEFLATLDSKTSPICSKLDGMVFTLAEKEVGVNFPPLHPNCRSTTVPFFDDEINIGERIAKDVEGNVYYVPGDIDYQEWYDNYVRVNELPKVVKVNDATLTKALRIGNTNNIWIPNNATIENVHIIAGKGVQTRLRNAERFADKYGGKPGDWQKLAGSVTSERYVFDVHWEQNGKKQVNHKIKSFSER